MFTFGKSSFVSLGWKNSDRILKNQGLYILLKLEGKDFSQILTTYLYMVSEFSVLTFGESNKCPNGLTVFTSSVGDTKVFYSDCIRRCCFIFFLKVSKIFHKTANSFYVYFFLSLKLQSSQMPKVISWQIDFRFKLLQKSQYWYFLF